VTQTIRKTRANSEAWAPAYDALTRLTPMARSRGYVMIRRPRAVPFVISEKDWLKLPKTESEGRGWRVSVLDGVREVKP
jgi:hypothetical protein